MTHGKTFRKVAAIALALLAVASLTAPNLEAQLIVVDRLFYPARLVNSTSDSTWSSSLYIDALPQTPSYIVQKAGSQRPDSVRLRFFVDGDSTYRVFVYGRFKHHDAPQTTAGYTRVLLDSLVSATATATTKMFTVAAATWTPYDLYNITLEAQADGNPSNIANAAEIWGEVERFFKVH